MENDSEKLYEAILKLNKRVTELDQKNIEIETLLSSVNFSNTKDSKENVVIDQETTVVDPYNMAGHKSVSMPNGGVIRLKSKSLCVNGRHIINNNEDILFCSKCNSIFCRDHSYGLDATICTNCLKEELGQFDNVSLYVLFALKNGISLSALKKRLNIPKIDLDNSLKKLKETNCATQDIFFRYKLSIYGEEVLNIASLLYNFDFLFE